MISPTPNYTDLSTGIANPKATFLFPFCRISILTTRTIRVEVSPQGQFCDTPSQQILFRNQPLPDLNVVQNGNALTISSPYFELRYTNTQHSPSWWNFKITSKETGATYRYGAANRGNFPGTTRTLDRTNGQVKLSQSFLSRSGWTVIDDTKSLLFTSKGWLEPRPKQEGYKDLYLLVCGHNYKEALAHYQQVAGNVPLIPRYMLGNWWSRYWEYSDAEIRTLVGRFQKEEIPLSVFIIDMDWHITKTGNQCSGWTGFSWNRELFPNPPDLLDWLHQNNLSVALNLHPAEGVHPHEDQYPTITEHMGIDPASQAPVKFDITDPRFAKEYFETLLHPMENEGVDFWWIDWQQGHLSGIPSLDPLWWLNHLHYQDLGSDKAKRPAIFSRWGGPGSHRYPIGFSGDTIISWASLALQPFFTSTAANVAYGWWSHDIGGHMIGRENAELYTRWVQYGLLSPILRLHSTKDKKLHHLPWGFDEPTLQAARQAMQLRNALVPYLYAMAHRYETTGLPLCLPLYFEWPQDATAYKVPNQYLFGDQLLAAPVTRPAKPGAEGAAHKVWFPAGEWVDFFNGEHFVGPVWHNFIVPVDRIPLYAKAGAIIPLRSPLSREDGSNPAEFDLIVFPGAEGRFELYEDDNTSQKYHNGAFCTTMFEQKWDGTNMQLTVHASQGDLSLLPETRSYRLHLRGMHENIISASINGETIQVPSKVDGEIVFQAVTVRSGEEVVINIQGLA
ncbi:hypothetical protein SDC9_69322 [bioreactor metagenome]|uniref:Uncharacterized protein n=1 Tax=bioreactor metagenome TaxID=1076179 RepID=A0A644Y8G1_9ZZZZ